MSKSKFDPNVIDPALRERDYPRDYRERVKRNVHLLGDYAPTFDEAHTILVSGKFISAGKASVAIDKVEAATLKKVGGRARKLAREVRANARSTPEQKVRILLSALDALADGCFNEAKAILESLPS